MGLSYSAEVFYGIPVPQRSKIGKVLDALIDEHGGTPAPVKWHPDVQIYLVGSQCTGEQWIAVAAKNSFLSLSRDDEVRAPVQLLVLPEWARQLRTFLNEIGVDSEETIGWYFGMSVG